MKHQEKISLKSDNSRMSFIGYTYLHLTGALGIAALSSERPLFKQSLPLLLVENIAALTILYLMTNNKYSPLKYVLFVLFCVLIGQILSPGVKAAEKKGTLRTVLASVAGIFLAMTTLGFIDNQNLLGMGAYLFVALIGLLIARLLLIAFNISDPRAKGLSDTNNLFSWVSTILFALFVAYDTQRLKERQQKPYDYINSSLGLFLDIINLFSSENR